MKIIDLFMPKHKHSDPSVRMAALEKNYMNEKLLKYMRNNDKDEKIRMRANQLLIIGYSSGLWK